MKFVSYRGVFKSFLLLFSTFNFLSITESLTHFTNVKVGLFLGDCIDHRKTSVDHLYGINIDDYNQNASFTKISLQIKTILFHGLSFEEISRTFCSSVLEDNVTVIILQSRNKNLARFISNLASYFKIPVIGSINQAPLLSDKVRGKKLSFLFLIVFIVEF